jgi:chemotaxis protein CheD
MEEVLNVRIATMRVVKNPRILVCRGLGSCVGLALWDNKTRVGGMAHILLPSEDYSINKENPLKFADKAIELMLAEMEKVGAKRKNTLAKIAGGARMFGSPTPTDRIHVGERNVIAVKDKLRAEKVQIVSEDIGGNKGRTMEFHTRDGKVVIYLADKTSYVL